MMHMMRTGRPWWGRCGTAGVVMVLLAGCSGGPSDRPKLAPVRGVVTLDGEPLPNKEVTFSPESGRPSTGMTNEKGEYELNYTGAVKGAMIGTHKVTIITPLPPEADPRKAPEPIPAKYNARSELTAEVKDQKNVINFDLTSK